MAMFDGITEVCDRFNHLEKVYALKLKLIKSPNNTLPLIPKGTSIIKSANII